MAEALSTIKRVKIINRIKLVVVALNVSNKSFVVYIAYLDRKILIYLTSNVQTTFLMAEKVTVLTEYLDFTNIFSKKVVT